MITLAEMPRIRTYADVTSNSRCLDISLSFHQNHYFVYARTRKADAISTLIRCTGGYGDLAYLFMTSIRIRQWMLIKHTCLLERFTSVILHNFVHGRVLA